MELNQCISLSSKVGSNFIWAIFIDNFYGTGNSIIEEEMRSCWSICNGSNGTVEENSKKQEKWAGIVMNMCFIWGITVDYVMEIIRTLYVTGPFLSEQQSDICKWIILPYYVHYVQHWDSSNLKILNHSYLQFCTAPYFFYMISSSFILWIHLECIVYILWWSLFGCSLRINHLPNWKKKNFFFFQTKNAENFLSKVNSNRNWYLKFLIGYHY